MTIHIDRFAGVSDGLGRKAPARFVTIEAIELYGLTALDDAQILAETDRVLVRFQSDLRENGLYNPSSGPWTRALDFDGPRDVAPGTSIVVTNGDVGPFTEFVAVFQGAYTPDVTPIQFSPLA